MTAARKFDPLSEVPPPPDSDSAKAPEAARRTLETMDRIGLPFAFRHLEPVPETLEAMAAALGVDQDYIAVSTLYRGKATRKPVLMIHSAASNLSDKLLAQVVGENLQRADADFTTRYTGFSGNCIPPTGHLNRVPIMLDSTLTRFARVWCSAGAPGCLVSVPTLVLARVISARIVRLEA